uniref:developmental pluripotency-associated 5 protein-like n=1 Tax=Callithrix jacchus TaxID=9483 RepID=UPI0023DD09B7|nr:developmental pluripotency-associated 5 protein-like [Callithrix jacchus]
MKSALHILGFHILKIWNLDKFLIVNVESAEEDLKDPEVFQVQMQLMEAMFGRDRCQIPYIEQVSKAMLELKALESPDFTEVVVYGSYIYKLRAKWMLQSMAEWHCQRQERGMLKLEKAMNALELSPWMN